MLRSILSSLGCLNCFRTKKQKLEVIVASPESCECGADRPSSTLVDYENEKEDAKAHQRALTPPSTPRTNPSLLVVAKGRYEINRSCTFPSLSHEGEVIIRSVAVGLNPIDWKSVDYGFCLPEFPWITGREMAGVVEQIGSEVTGLKVGQRVWTSKSIQRSHQVRSDRV